LSKVASLFVACLSVFISIRRGFEENGSYQEKKQMVVSLGLDPLGKDKDEYCKNLLLPSAGGGGSGSNGV
jgi:hypothetical protein